MGFGFSISGAGLRGIAAVAAAVLSLSAAAPVTAFHEDRPRCVSRSTYAFIEYPEDGYVEVNVPRVAQGMPFPLSGGGIGTWLLPWDAWMVFADPAQPPYFLYDVAVCHVATVTATLTLTTADGGSKETQGFGRRGQCIGSAGLGGVFDMPLGVSIGELRIVARPCRAGAKPLTDSVGVRVFSLQMG